MIEETQSGSITRTAMGLLKNGGGQFMRQIWILTISLMVGGMAARAQQSEESPDKTYLKHTFSPVAAGRAAMGAAVNQANNTPSEWGQGAAGFGKRFASSFAKHLVKKGIQYPVSKLFHEELSYQRSDKTGFGPRLKYALAGTVITHKTTTGESTIAKGELAGAFGSGFISRAWQPASVRTASAGFTSAGLVLGIDAAGNVIKEFWPEIRHPRSHNSGHVKDAPDPSESTVGPIDAF